MKKTLSIALPSLEGALRCRGGRTAVRKSRRFARLDGRSARRRQLCRALPYDKNTAARRSGRKAPVFSAAERRCGELVCRADVLLSGEQFAALRKDAATLRSRENIGAFCSASAPGHGSSVETLRGASRSSEDVLGNGEHCALPCTAARTRNARLSARTAERPARAMKRPRARINKSAQVVAGARCVLNNCEPESTLLARRSRTRPRCALATCSVFTQRGAR